MGTIRYPSLVVLILWGIICAISGVAEAELNFTKMLVGFGCVLAGVFLSVALQKR